jgi:transposase InsO family protein
MDDRHDEQDPTAPSGAEHTAHEPEPRGGAIGGDRPPPGRDDAEPRADREGPTAEELVQRVRARLTGPRGGRRTVRAQTPPTRVHLRPAQRLLILDTWVRSKLPAREFADLFGLSPHTLYAWKKRFDEEGPAGLDDAPRGGPRGSRMPEAARRAILLMKSQHPEWGQDRLHAMLLRSEGLGASPGAIARVLAEEGYQVVSEPTVRHEPKVTRFESAAPNAMWQTDLFTFTLKRENRRVWMVAFLDDHSRFVVGYGIFGSSSGALVREVLEAAIANFGAPREILTDNGPQYRTWRGKSAFTQLLERRGIKHTLARPRHPQTLGKIERFWGTLWRELLETAIFQGLDDARKRIGHFIDHYNFQRTHTGIDGLVPADRYFHAADTVRKSLNERVAQNALSLAQHGAARKSFYLTGRVGDETIALHAQGSRVVLTKGDGSREEVDLAHEGPRAEPREETSMPEPVAVCAGPSDVLGAEIDEEEGDLAPPGSSPLDGVIDELAAGLDTPPSPPPDTTKEADDEEDGPCGALVLA